MPPVTTTYVRQYEEGTLVLDIVNAKSNQLMWRGSAQAEINRQLKPEEREKRLQEAIGKILAQFPPKKK
jgi:hypothetical protein